MYIQHSEWKMLNNNKHPKSKFTKTNEKGQNIEGGLEKGNQSVNIFLYGLGNKINKTLPRGYNGFFLYPVLCFTKRLTPKDQYTWILGDPVELKIHYKLLST